MTTFVIVFNDVMQFPTHRLSMSWSVDGRRPPHLFMVL